MLVWGKPVRAGEIRLAFDTGLKTRRVMLPMPRELVRDYAVEIDAVRVTVLRAWGDRLSRIHELRVY